MIEPAGSPSLSLGVNHIQNILQKTDRGDEEQVCAEAHENLLTWGFNTADMVMRAVQANALFRSDLFNKKCKLSW